MISRLLVQIAKRHARCEKSDESNVQLKAYDPTGAFLVDYIRINVDEAGRPKQWRLRGNTMPAINITRADVSTLAAMSPIGATNMGTCYKSYADVVAAGAHSSPLEQNGHPLGDFCGGAPLFNQHFLEAVQAGITHMPMIPRNFAPRATSRWSTS